MPFVHFCNNFSVSSRIDIPVCKNKKGTQLSSFFVFTNRDINAAAHAKVIAKMNKRHYLYNLIKKKRTL